MVNVEIINNNDHYIEEKQKFLNTPRGVMPRLLDIWSSDYELSFN